MADYSPLAGNDTTVGLATRSVQNLERLQKLRMRATVEDDAMRRQLAEKWDEDTNDIFEDQVLPPEYYRQALEIVSEIESLDEDDDVLFSEVERMVADFTPAGQKGRGGQNGLSETLMGLAERYQNQMMSPSES